MNYGTILARNTGARTCTITGYPGITMLTGPKQAPFPTDVRRAAGTHPAPVTLPPGATASFGFAHGSFPGGHCDKANGLRVFDPDGSGYAATNSAFNECSGIPATITVGPFEAGAHAAIQP